MLRFTGAELKTMQTGASLHDSRDARYGTRAVTAEKRKAQEAVVAFLFPGKTQERWLCLGGLPAGRTLFVPLCRQENGGILASP